MICQQSPRCLLSLHLSVSLALLGSITWRALSTSDLSVVSQPFPQLFRLTLIVLRSPKLASGHTSPAMSPATEFYRSQVGGNSVINYGYTDLPWRLLIKDIYFFFTYAWALPWILLPVSPYGSGDLDELYPSWRNIFCISVHFVLVIFQLLFLLALPISLFFPIWMGITGVAGFLTFNWLICKLLNGKEVSFQSDEKYAKALPEHAHEQWVFLNGVAVG